MSLILQELKHNKNDMELRIREILNQFEKKYGENIIASIHLERWNGSNTAFGKIGNVKIGLRLD